MPNAIQLRATIRKKGIPIAAVAPAMTFPGAVQFTERNFPKFGNYPRPYPYSCDEDPKYDSGSTLEEQDHSECNTR